MHLNRPLVPAELKLSIEGQVGEAQLEGGQRRQQSPEPGQRTAELPALVRVCFGFECFLHFPNRCLQFCGVLLQLSDPVYVLGHLFQGPARRDDWDLWIESLVAEPVVGVTVADDDVAGGTARQLPGGIPQILACLGHLESVKHQRLVAQVNDSGIAKGGATRDTQSGVHTLGNPLDLKVLRFRHPHVALLVYLPIPWQLSGSRGLVLSLERLCFPGTRCLSARRSYNSGCPGRR